ncbi:MAG: class I SAM-dependent methyltransferase [Acidimicrobiia bacterium]
MTPVEPHLFYTGVVAQLYAPLRSMVPDPEPYARFIATSGEPALELGCGTGDPLLDLRGRGLDIEGLDSSADMLARCRSEAAGRGLDVVLHHQPMESMDLVRKYQSIFLAGPTFNLLADDDTARHALERVRAHLQPQGRALIPLFVPAATPPEDLGRTREHTSPDDTCMRVTPISEQRDEFRRTQTTVLRYELITDHQRIVEERPWLLHWHTQDGFHRLATDAGFAVRATLRPDGTDARPTDQAFVFILANPTSTA